MAASDPDRAPTLREFADEVIEALRAAGLAGPVAYDGERGRLTHEKRGTFDLEHAFHDLAHLPKAKRGVLLEKAARLWTNPPSLPETWEKASETVLPFLKTRMATVTEDARRRANGIAASIPRADVNEHLTFELALPLESASVCLSTDLLGRWGVAPDAAFRAAGANLVKRSEPNWLVTPEAPGVYGSPWEDGFDVARMFLPGQFARVPVRGRPVVVAPYPSRLLFTGSDDEDGLFHMARLARRSLERNQGFYFLRTFRMGDDGTSWREWSPPKGHPAFDLLRFLRGIQESGEYDQQAAVVAEMAPGGSDVLAMPPLRLVQSEFGVETMTVTTWDDAGEAALPKADAILFRRGDETLGWAPWDAVGEVLGATWKKMPGYPTRFRVPRLPDDWQFGPLELRPWPGPPP